MAGRWIADGPPGFVPGTGGFLGTPKGDMVEHDCKVPGKGGDSPRSWTCSTCGRPWRWSPGSTLVTWGESKAPKRRGFWG